MSIILLANYMSEDKSFGAATKEIVIKYNLKKLDRHDPDSSPFFSIGRYICLIGARDEEKTLLMMYFMDLIVDPSLIEKATEFNSGYGKQKIMSLMEIYNMNYKSTFGLVELSTDLPDWLKSTL